MIVIDASVWVSFLIQQDTHHAITRAWLSKILLNRSPIVAPIILLSEVGAALSRRLRNPQIGNKAINQLLAIPTLRLVSIDHTLGIQSARIAADNHLRGADAIYVALAAQLAIPLVSWDQEHIKRTTNLIVAHTPT